MKSQCYAVIALSLSLAVAGGCSNEATEESVAEPAAQLPEPPEVEEEVVEEVEEVVEEPAGPTADSVPIPEDFADEAAEEITAKNYKGELAAMEKDLAE